MEIKIGEVEMVVRDVVAFSVEKAANAFKNGIKAWEIICDELPNQAWEDDRTIRKLYRETVKAYYQLASKLGLQEENEPDLLDD